MKKNLILYFNMIILLGIGVVQQSDAVTTGGEIISASEKSLPQAKGIVEKAKSISPSIGDKFKKFLMSIMGSNATASKTIGDTVFIVGIADKSDKLIAAAEIQIYASSLKRNLYTLYDPKGNKISEGRAYVTFLPENKNDIVVSFIPGTITSYIPGLKSKPLLGFQAPLDKLKNNGTEGYTMILPNITVYDDLKTKSEIIPIKNAVAIVISHLPAKTGVAEKIITASKITLDQAALAKAKQAIIAAEKNKTVTTTSMLNSLTKTISSMTSSTVSASSALGDTKIRMALVRSNGQDIVGTLELDLTAGSLSRNLFTLYDPNGNKVSDGRAYVEFSKKDNKKVDISLTPGTITSFIPGMKNSPILGFEAPIDDLKNGGVKDFIIVKPDLVVYAAPALGIPITDTQALMIVGPASILTPPAPAPTPVNIPEPVITPKKSILTPSKIEPPVSTPTQIKTESPKTTSHGSSVAVTPSTSIAEKTKVFEELVKSISTSKSDASILKELGTTTLYLMLYNNKVMFKGIGKDIATLKINLYNSYFSSDAYQILDILGNEISSGYVIVVPSKTETNGAIISIIPGKWTSYLVKNEPILGFQAPIDDLKNNGKIGYKITPPNLALFNNLKAKSGGDVLITSTTDIVISRAM